MGCTFQGPNLAAQTVLATADVPIGTSIMFFSQLLGGAIFTSVASNVLSNELLKNLANIPGVNPAAILSEGATSLLNGIPESSVGAVLLAYNSSLRTVFQVGLAMSCIVISGSAAMEWRSVKSKKAAADQKKRELQDVEAGAEKKNAEDARSVETTADNKHEDWEAKTGSDEKNEVPTSKAS